ncbi:14635_t:CDS:2, partial [Acaulospora colombiana]
DDSDFLRINDLDWSEVTVPDSMFIADEDDLGGFLCLEEVDGVHIEYEETDTKGNTIKFKKTHGDQRSSKKRKKNPPAKPEEPFPADEMLKYHDLDTFDEGKLIDTSTEESESRSDIQSAENSESDEGDASQNEVDLDAGDMDVKERSDRDDGQVDTAVESMNKESENINLDAWDKFNLSPDILNGLKFLKFIEPTPIQEKALPAGLSGRDVVGSAETGSGKTLAFGIPILNHIIKNRELNIKNQLSGLVLTPTRELAIQIKDHLVNIGNLSLQVMAIVGGMAVQKQKRLLEKMPDIIVATPGRLWELLSENDDYLRNIRHVKHLVLDEADRMLETGHFKELDHILTILSRNRQKIFRNTSEWNDDKTSSEGTRDPSLPRQTFVFSATLDSKLKENLKRRGHKLRKIEAGSKGTMAELMQRLEFSDPDPVFIDITPEESVVKGLQESKIECLTKDK